jgi:CheY-like chemotaxis protein
MSQNKPHLVIADDEVHILKILELKFSNNGFDVTKAFTGQQAWELISVNPPDAVITDYQMPELTGLDLAEKMYSDYALRKIPVILFRSLPNRDRQCSLISFLLI